MKLQRAGQLVDDKLTSVNQVNTEFSQQLEQVLHEVQPPAL